MWIFTRYGFFSVAATQGDFDKVMVRARARKHLENLQKKFELDPRRYPILTSQGTDYKYRIILSKEFWTRLLHVMATEQTWSNFKKEAAQFADDPIYDIALHAVWQLMYGAGAEWEFEAKRRKK